MSLKASNWAKEAAKGLGLSSSAKNLLRELADRHNVDFGCFPSQARLAADTEISRSQVNVLLNVLEQKKLIRREKVWDDVTKRQKPTRYLLAFEDGFVPLPDADDSAEMQRTLDLQPTEPSPEIGHGNGPETVSDKRGEPCPVESVTRVRFTGHAIDEPENNQKESGAGACAREQEPPENGKLKLFAAKIREGIHVSPMALTAGECREMVRLGEVTVEQLADRGFWI